MTFAVIELTEANEKVIGTIWADAQDQAESIASNLLHVPEKERLVIRRSEDREIPMKPFN